VQLAATVNQPMIWTPDARKELARRTHADMLTFNEGMALAKSRELLPTGEIEAWRLFRDGWSRWFGDTSGSTWLWDSSVAVVEGYANQLAEWRKKYVTWTGTPAPGANTLQLDTHKIVSGSVEYKLPATLPTINVDWTGVYVVLGVIAVVGGALYLRKTSGGQGLGEWEDQMATRFAKEAVTQMRKGDVKRARAALEQGKVLLERVPSGELERAARKAIHDAELAIFQGAQRKSLSGLSGIAGIDDPDKNLFKRALVKFREKLDQRDLENARDYLELADNYPASLEDGPQRAKAAREVAKAADKLEKASRRLAADLAKAERRARRTVKKNDDLGSLDAEFKLPQELPPLQFEELEIGRDDPPDDDDDDDDYDEGPRPIPVFRPMEFKPLNWTT